MEQDCPKCGEIGIQGEYPDNPTVAFFVCDNCGRCWDEYGNVFEEGLVKP